jgi:hypothetical protein
MSARTAVSAAVLLVAASAAHAQSSLGIHSGGVSFGVMSADSTEELGFGSGWLDVAVTGVHGLQFGLTLEDTAAGTLGTFDAHLYMAPHNTAKYGLFVIVSDLDGANFTMAVAGAEGMFALGERTTAEIRTGVGIAKRTAAPDSLDFVFVGGGINHEINPTLNIGLTFDVAEYDEPALQAYGYTVMAEAEYRPGNGPISLTAGVGISGLEGTNGGPSETLVKLGLTYTFGAGSGTHRPFRRAAPYAPLALRASF